MGYCNDNGRSVFPLTSLQIGDLQSYLSHLELFLAPESKKLYILVDNRPWLKDLASRPTHLWQLMVTKSRLSPFANTRGRKGKNGTADDLRDVEVTSGSKSSETEAIKRWFSLVDAATLSQKRALLPVKKIRNTLISNSKLHKTLYGFIVFEVAWDDVRGMNYLNELQTDTSLAIEAKFMKRWEFDCIMQAVNCLSSWFPGTINEQILLKERLNSTTGEVFYEAQETFSRTNNDSTSVLHTPTFPGGPYQRRKFHRNKVRSVDSESSSDSDCEDLVAATQYRDVLMLFRFNDSDLPFKLKDIIMSDLRLLTLLESGLPSWVIFLQSYPGFCHLYRPWMCPLARAFYVLISIITVLIGFYDLYKNVPVLKATASRLCGPLFDWIETWEMISRIKYLGTMLFLHNFEKAVKWFLMTSRSVRSSLLIFTGPMNGPFSQFLDCFQGLVSGMWIVVELCCSLVWNLTEMLLLPVWYLVSFIWSTTICIIYPIFWILREIIYAPVRLTLGLSNLVAFICSCIYDLIEDIWQFLSCMFRFSSQVTNVGSTGNSMWRSLWNDLFSQVFRAVRSILNGFVAFVTACNRHRLSIYNHVRELGRRLSESRKRSRCSSSGHVRWLSFRGLNELEGYEEGSFLKSTRIKWYLSKFGLHTSRGFHNYPNSDYI